MDIPPAAKRTPRSSRLSFLPQQDPDIMEIGPSSSWNTSSYQKRRHSQDAPIDIVEINDDDDQDAVVIIGESTSGYKNKQTVMYHTDTPSQKKHASSNDLMGSITKHGLGYDTPLGTLNGYEPLLSGFNYPVEYDYEEDEYDVDGYEDYEFDSDLIESNFNFNLASNFDDLGLPPVAEATVPWLQKSIPERPCQKKSSIVIEDEIDRKFRSFKQFDTVMDHSDHLFSKSSSAIKKTTTAWAKRIQHEWKVLEKDLPETIYVRIYEDRMDLLRAVIIGPDGTPYHDGLFFFDVHFPPTYPNVPPKVLYHSGGLRLNPNLYACGKVCLSLLNTWSGSGCEKWCPSKSTMLQVLVSIQALVLNAKPYFNEPGFAPSVNTPYGETQSLNYNENTFLLSCRTILYSLRRAPKHFEEFVTGHFRKQGRAILVACRAYMDGAQVGCLAGDGIQDVDEGDKSCSLSFKNSLKSLYNSLLAELTSKGADCSGFLAHKDGNLLTELTSSGANTMMQFL